LHDQADEVLVCDPRRNGLIAKDGDKDDPIDAGKLCDLFCGGYLRAVHHSLDVERVVFKQEVGLYHERVSHRVAEANKIIGHLRAWGIVVREGAFEQKKDRKELLDRLAAAQAGSRVAERMGWLWKGYDVAVDQESRLRREVEKLARGQEAAVRWTALPGIAWIRAAALVAYLDTPFRFKIRQALWKYLGIGLTREKSGEGKEYLHVEQACNHILKGVILGAAESAILQRDNPFAELYRRWLEARIAPANARRNVARALATVGWGMWKSGEAYDPQRVGRMNCL
jgi:transposase